MWLPLKLLGAAAFRRCLDEKLDLAQWTATQLEAVDGVDLLAKPRLSTVAFRVRRDGYDAAQLDTLNQAILERIMRIGRVHLEDLQRAMREVA